jgi:hypothetical protein
MVHPHDEDGDEARPQREKRGPLLSQTFEQRKPIDGRIMEIENEQRDGEREDAVAEGLHPRGFAFLTPFLVFEAHDVVPTAGSRAVSILICCLGRESLLPD